MAIATALATAAGPRRRPERYLPQARIIAAILLVLLVLWHVDAALDPFGVETEVRALVAGSHPWSAS